MFLLTSNLINNSHGRAQILRVVGIFCTMRPWQGCEFIKLLMKLENLSLIIKSIWIKKDIIVWSVLFSHSVLLTLCDPWTAACQTSLSITNTWSLLKFMSIESVMPSDNLILCRSLLLLLSMASGSFQMSQLFASGGQSIGVSALTSVLPMNIQDWFLLEQTGWISLQSKGLSRVLSNATVQRHQFFSAQVSL